MNVRAALLGALCLLLAFAGLAARNPGLLAMTLLLLAYLGVGLLTRPAPPDLVVERSIQPQRAEQGQPVEVELEIANQGSRQHLFTLQDQLAPALSLVAGSPILTLRLEGGASVTMSYSVRGGRGLYRFQQAHLTCSDPLGLWNHVVSLPAPGRFFVLPQPAKTRRVSLRPRQTLSYAGSIPSRQAGAGVEFYGVRDYLPGDPQRRINWKASARAWDTYFTNDYRQERVADVRLILDARRRSDIHVGGDSLFEYSVNAAATLAQDLLGGGNRVGLLVYGQYLDLTHPGYGKLQYERILRALARAQPGDSLVFGKLEFLPTRFLPLSAHLVLVSPLHSDDRFTLRRLRARGYQVLALSPDPVAFEASRAPQDDRFRQGLRLAGLERRLLLNQVRRTGTLVVNWEVHTSLDAALQGAARLYRQPRPEARLYG